MASPRLPSVRLATDDVPRGPWIFARTVVPPRDVADGALVEVRDASDRFLGHALYNGASDIRLRWLSRGRRTDLDRPREFLLARLREADRLRRKVLRLPEVTDTYRVVHAEGDALPGLVVDRLASVLVCEHHARGFFELRREIEWALGELYPGLEVLHRVPPAAGRAEGFEPPADSPAREVVVAEHGLEFPVLAGGGHKTGWFCDQRDNRQLLAKLARGQRVLDVCCNAGGFALHAAQHGARSVRGVDLDEKVLARARAAAAAGGLAVDFVHGDAYDHLRELERASERPGVVIVDPHKLIAGRRDLEKGLSRYLDLNSLALRCVREGGLLATFSCSGALSAPAFAGMLFQAARRAGRSVQLLSRLGAGPDHPERPEFPRSRYLKGARVAVGGRSPPPERALASGSDED
jgi:23S rRNA (cytosine1962-C5)-methyltransferase